MSTQATVRYLTKTDAAHWFRRSERSLSRDIINAIKMADQDMLQHVRLRLEDGTVRPGTEITIEEIIRLRDEGQNPTWELAVVWLEARYGRRGDTPREEAEADGPPPVGKQDDDPAAAERELPAEPELRLAVLEAINSELETRNKEKDNQIRRLETELDRRAEERREENELQKQNNVLMQQIYDLLRNMQEASGEVNFLANAHAARALPLGATTEHDKSRAVDAEVVPTPEPPPPTQERSQQAAKPPRKKARQKKRAASKRKARTTSRRKQTKPADSQPPKKSTGKHASTFGRFARSLFGR